MYWIAEFFSHVICWCHCSSLGQCFSSYLRKRQKIKTKNQNNNNKKTQQLNFGRKQIQFWRHTCNKKVNQFKWNCLVFCCRETNPTINSLALHGSGLGCLAGMPGCRWVFVQVICAAFATSTQIWLWGKSLHWCFIVVIMNFDNEFSNQLLGCQLIKLLKFWNVFIYVVEVF